MNKPVDAMYGTGILYKDIPYYIDDFLTEAIYHYSMTKKWGLAWGGCGWAEQPKIYIEAITAMEDVINEIEKESLDKKTKNKQDTE